MSSAFMTTPPSKLTFFNKSTMSCIVQCSLVGPGYEAKFNGTTLLYICIPGLIIMDLPFVKFDEQGIDFSEVL